MFDRRAVIAGGLCATLAPAFSALAKGGNPLIDAFVAETKFQGVIATARAGRIGEIRAFGLADVAAKRVATPTTSYAIASISKWLTTLAVLRLVEQGRLALDAPITATLPEYRADTGAKITLAHLLSNTSGIPNGFLPALKADPGVMTRNYATDDAVKLFCSGDLAFEPGTKFDYALTNWFVVKAMIEHAAAMPYLAVMAALVTTPLGLKATRADTNAPDAPGAALSYRTDDPTVVWPDLRHTLTAPGGGFYSDAQDLVRAAHLVFDGTFLTRESLAAMGKVLVPEQDYALGGRVRTMTIAGKPVTAAWETGRTAGFRSLLAHRYDTRETVVILNNTGLSQKALDLFGDKLFGAEPRPD